MKLLSVLLCAGLCAAQISTYPSGTGTGTITLSPSTFLQGSASTGWQLGSEIAAVPRYATIRPIAASSGAFHFYLFPGTADSTNGVYLSNSTDLTVANAGLMTLGISGATGFLRISCADCGQPFEFFGVPFGMSFYRPTVSLSKEKLRVPLVLPGTEPPSGLAGFAVTHTISKEKDMVKQ